MRILLAEDEKQLSDALVMILKHNSYSVDVVYDGEEALNYIECIDYDAIVLDIMMPKVDGIEVLKTIRDRGNTVPVLMLTAKSETDDKVLGLDLGADDYLTKPFEMKELLARLRAITRRNLDTLDNYLNYGNTLLNRGTFEIENGSNKTRLSNKEYQIMELLMSNPNNVISTERIMEKVWGYDSDSENNVVWVYISYLRKKLKEISSDIVIKAIRNSGYILEKKE